MDLVPLDNNDLIETVATWLNEERNYQWLDFGNGVQRLNATALKIMAQKDTHYIRAFTADDTDKPIGVVGLSNVDRNFKTATLWAALGVKNYSRKGYAFKSNARILSAGFRELGLEAINAWIVECNHASLALARNLGLREVGRQRRCHYIDGSAYDRILFDILASEYRNIDDA